MVEFYLSLKREEGESEMEQRISVFWKYTKHICEGHTWRKWRKREIYESWLELDRWKQTKSRGFFYSFESSNFPKGGNMSMPIRKYPTTEQELDMSPKRLHPINNFGFKLRLFNWNSRGEKKRRMGGSRMAKNHQCQVAVEKMLNMTLGFNRWSISSIDGGILAALSGNYILYTMYSFGHCSRKRN